MSISESAIKAQDAKFSSLGLTKTIVNAEYVATYSRGLGSISDSNPVLVLLHGYPQSSFMWRHLIPLLPSNAPLFVPDLPGYGVSKPIENNDKLAVGQTILSALITQVKRSSSGSPSSDIPVILLGHDRGARVAHRLAVSGYDGVNIKAVAIMDIMPGLMQWRAAAEPKNIVGYFHWPLLANVSQATAMLTAYGGDRWCTDMILRWGGTSTSSIRQLKSDDALTIYGTFFKEPTVIEASCKDYEAGAFLDIDREKEDQEQGRKLSVPVLLVWSEGYLGGRYGDVVGHWKEWTKEGTELTGKSIKDSGHFVVEEAPDQVADAVKGWLKELGVGL